MIRTLKYGKLPTTKQITRDIIIDTVEMDNGDIYEVRTTLRGVLVAVKIKQ